MQHPIQNETATETTTNQPASQPATLAELLAARAEEIADEQRDEQRRAQRAREQERADALARADTYLRDHIWPPLAAILHMTPAVDEHALQLAHDDPEGYYPAAGYLQLDLRGAGIDDGEDAAADPHRADRWRLRHEYTRHLGYAWFLHGPHDYAVEMPRLYSSDERIGVSLIDAIAAYPAWLEAADERAKREAEREAERERTRQSKQVQHYDSITGYSLTAPGLLSAGHHLLVLTRDPRAEDGMIERRGVLESYSEHWLLLNLDDHTRGTLGAQTLIPIASVIEIQPLPDVEAAGRQEEATAAN